MLHGSLGGIRRTALPFWVWCSVVLALNFEGGSCVGLPATQTVQAYKIAFFQCEVPEKGLPLWLINTTEYLSSNLIPDHATNISGLIVHARPEYNNTVYECRFVDVTIDEFGFIDKKVLTSPPAVLTIIDTITDEPMCSCDRNAPTRATYNYTSQLLTISLSESLFETSLFGVSVCSGGTEEKSLNETCSALDVDFSPEDYSHLVLIAFPPVCNACVPVLDYTIYMGIDFSLNATIPSSVVQQFEISGTCLESRLYLIVPDQCTDLQIYMSANGKSSFVDFSNEQFFSLSFDHETLQICFQSSGPFHEIFGNVKEVFVQEVCVINPDVLCGDPQTLESASHIHLFGSKGRLPLPFNQTDFHPETLCSLMDITSSSIISFSPSKMLTSSSQYLSSLMSITPTSANPQLTTSIVLVSTPTNIVPSEMISPSGSLLPSSSTMNGPIGTVTLALIVVFVCLLFVLLAFIMVFGVCVLLKRHKSRSYAACRIEKSDKGVDEDSDL